MFNNTTDIIYHMLCIYYQLYHLEQLHLQYYYLDCRITAVIDICTKGTCSNADNLAEPPTLSQLSASISDTHQHKMNVSISGMDDPKGHESELKDDMERDLKTDKAETVENPCEVHKK